MFDVYTSSKHLQNDDSWAYTPGKTYAIYGMFCVYTSCNDFKQQNERREP